MFFIRYFIIRIRKYLRLYVYLDIGDLGGRSEWFGVSMVEIYVEGYRFNGS